MNYSKALLHFLRYIWVLPISCVGLALTFIVLVSGGRACVVSGVIEAEGGILPFLLSRLNPLFPIDALTIGHVVLGQNRVSLTRCREHERIHVSQYERWGPLFPLLYFFSSLSALVQGMDPYRDNRFEQEAFSGSGLKDTV
jgi:hypothetical protein